MDTVASKTVPTTNSDTDSAEDCLLSDDNQTDKRYGSTGQPVVEDHTSEDERRRLKLSDTHPDVKAFTNVRDWLHVLVHAVTLI